MSLNLSRPAQGRELKHLGLLPKGLLDLTFKQHDQVDSRRIADQKKPLAFATPKEWPQRGYAPHGCARVLVFENLGICGEYTPETKSPNLRSSESIRTTSLDESRETEERETSYEIPAAGYIPEQLCSQREFRRLFFTRTLGNE